MSALRVLVSGVVLGQPQGGVRRHNQELLPRLSALLRSQGGQLDVLIGREPPTFALPEEIECIATGVPAGPPLRRVLHESRAIEHALLDARAKGQPYDLVHLAHFPVPPLLRQSYTITVHDLRSLTLAHTPFSRRFFARAVLSRAFQQARAVCTVSESMRAELRDKFRLPAQKVHLVSNAADHLLPLPRQPAAEPYLLHVGHLEPRKNLERLLLALAYDHQLPPLWLAGRAKADWAEHLTARAHALGIATRLRLLGPVSEEQLRTLYAGARAVVLPSHLEGFGIVALEAQRARVPLVIARQTALLEVAGADVPHFDPEDTAGCVTAIHAAMQQSSLRLEEHALRSARYSWQASAEQWLSVWQSLTR